MSFASKYNKTRRWNVNTDGFEFKKLADLYLENPEKVYVMRGVFIHKSKDKKYKDAPVVITDEYFVNLPSHLIEIVNDMLRDDDTVGVIESGAAGFKIYNYESDGKTYYSVYWVDIE